MNEKTKLNLMNLGLIQLAAPGVYRLTSKGNTTIEQGGYIIKYPMTAENGIVLNFRAILEGYSSSALHALGLSIINTESYKRWGKHTNE